MQDDARHPPLRRIYSMGDPDLSIGKSTPRSRATPSGHATIHEADFSEEEEEHFDPVSVRRRGSVQHQSKPRRRRGVGSFLVAGVVAAVGWCWGTEQGQQMLGENAQHLPASAQEATAMAWSATTQTAEFLADYLMLGEQCPYVEAPIEAVQGLLPQRIKGQEKAQQAILSAFQYWEMGRKQASQQPLVIAITGPTGVGKTETAHVLAEALLQKREKVSETGDRTRPAGLIIFRGEDFSDAEGAPLAQYHTEIKSRLVNHLRHCAGNAVVLFDEVQKIIPGTLDVIMEAMTEHPTLTYFADGKTVAMDCSKVVFILVSDIGWEKMVSKQLTYHDRSDIPVDEMRAVVKGALDEQWERLKFGKVVDEVIPYLPMEKEQMADVLQLKLGYLDKEFQGDFWRGLCVTEAAAAHLVSPQARLVTYKEYKTRRSEDLGIVKYFAEYGARNIESSGPLKALKTQLFRSMQPWRKEEYVLLSMEKDLFSLHWCKAFSESSECPNFKEGSPHWVDAMRSCTTVWSGSFSE